MNNMLDYIEEYGDFSFKEKAFNEVDNLIFSQLAYTDFKDIADKQSVSLLKGAKLFFAMYTQEEIENLIAISVKSADLLKKCSMTKRFSNVIMCDYINNVNDDIDKQFSAIHFLLDDGTNEKSWSELILSGPIHNIQNMKISLRWLNKMYQNPNCVAVLTSHDKDYKETKIEF
jgi:hypothetical protein